MGESKTFRLRFVMAESKTLSWSSWRLLNSPSSRLNRNFDLVIAKSEGSPQLSQRFSDLDSRWPNRNFDNYCGRIGRVSVAKSNTFQLDFIKVKLKLWLHRGRIEEMSRPSRRLYAHPSHGQIGEAVGAKSKTLWFAFVVAESETLLRPNPRLSYSTSSWSNWNFDFIVTELEESSLPSWRLSDLPLSMLNKNFDFVVAESERRHGRVVDFLMRLLHGRIKTLISSRQPL